MRNQNLRTAKGLDELLDLKYGKVGTPKRDKFEEEAQYFVITKC